MKIDEALKLVNEYCPPHAYLGGKGAERQSWQLVLVDYEPVRVYVQSTPFFLFVNTESPDLELGLKQTYRRANTILCRDAGLPATLRDLLYLRLQAYHTRELRKGAGLKITARVSPEELRAEGGRTLYNVEGVHRIEELKALLFLTEEFSLIEDAARHGGAADIELGLFSIGGGHPNAVGEPASTREYIAEWLDDFYLRLNFDLLSIYFKTLGSSMRSPQMKRMHIFNEFVPLFARFSGIRHPLIDGILQKTGMPGLNLIRISEVCTPTDQTIKTYLSEDTRTFILYTTRNDIKSMTGINANPKIYASQDIYDPGTYSEFITQKIYRRQGEQGFLSARPQTQHYIGISEESIVWCHRYPPTVGYDTLSRVDWVQSVAARMVMNIRESYDVESIQSIAAILHKNR